MFKRFCMVLVVFHHLLTVVGFGAFVFDKFDGRGVYILDVLLILGISLGFLIVICALQFVITGQWKPYALFKCNNNVTGK